MVETLLVFRKGIMFQASSVGVDVRVGEGVRKRWPDISTRLKTRGEYAQSM